MKFIHVADIHLDSPLRGLSAYENAPAERLRGATREAFAQLVRRAIEEAVDFMVIAGDLYDGNWRDFNTGLFFVRQMGILRQANIDVYLVYGNHDAESKITKQLQLPENVKVFSSKKAHTFYIESLKVALHGRSFHDAATTDNLAITYPNTLSGFFNIGILHTDLEGNNSHSPYAPCSIAELDAKGYQYWALGHVHKQWIRRGETTIAFPGNLQGRSIRETGPRGALLVTVEEGEVCAVEPLWLDVLRWAELAVNLSGQNDQNEAMRAVGQALGKLLQQQEGDYPLAVRVQLQGTCTIHHALLANTAQLREEVLAQAIALDANRLWIEKVQLKTQAPALTTTSTNTSTSHLNDGTALASLHGLTQEALQDAQFLADLQSDLNSLLTALPIDVLQASAELEALHNNSDGAIQALLADTLPILLARVQQASK